MHPPPSPNPITKRRRWALLFLFAFPALLLAIYLVYPRTPRCSSDCIVFIGDSITAKWPALKPENQISGLQIVNRGLPGDTTTNMLFRFRRDIIQLHPRVVVVLGGLNDLARTPLPTIEQNLAVMSETARDHKIRVILATLPPARERNSPAAPERQSSEHDLIGALNAWIRSFAAENRYTLVDYCSVLSDGRGTYQEALTTDGVHPSAAGYALMEPLLREAVHTALK